MEHTSTVEPELHLVLPDDYHQEKETPDICAESQMEIDRTEGIESKENTEESLLNDQALYRDSIQIQKRKFLNEEIDEMETNGIIRKSSNPNAQLVDIEDKNDAR